MRSHISLSGILKLTHCDMSNIFDTATISPCVVD